MLKWLIVEQSQRLKKKRNYHGLNRKISAQFK